MRLSPSLLCTILALGLLAPSLVLPIEFKFSVEKGRLVYYAVMIAASVLAAVFGNSTESVNQTQILPLPVAAWTLPLAAGVLLGVSWLLSVHFYETREL